MQIAASSSPEQRCKRPFAESMRKPTRKSPKTCLLTSKAAVKQRRSHLLGCAMSRVAPITPLGVGVNWVDRVEFFATPLLAWIIRLTPRAIVARRSR